VTDRDEDKDESKDEAGDDDANEAEDERSEDDAAESDDARSSDDARDDDAEADEADEDEPPPKPKAAPSKKPASKRAAPAASTKAAPKKVAAKKVAAKKTAEPEKKGGWLFYVVVAVVAAGGVTAWQTKKANEEARARVEAACAKIRPLEDKQAQTLKDGIDKFYGESGARLKDAVDAGRISPVCDTLPAELQGFSWNYGRNWEPPKSKAQQNAPTPDEIHDIMVKSGPYCEKKVDDMLSMYKALGGEEVPEDITAGAKMICDPASFAQRISPAAVDPGPKSVLEGWPQYLEKHAKGFEAATAPVAPTPPDPSDIYDE
jgi:hypothetical protein